MINLTAVEAILFAALDKPSDPERTAFLDAACGHDADLRRHVERLLSAYPRATDFLTVPAPGCWARPTCHRSRSGPAP